jgi:hypothetical protein
MDGENCEERKVNYEFWMMNRNQAVVAPRGIGATRP